MGKLLITALFALILTGCAIVPVQQTTRVVTANGTTTTTTTTQQVVVPVAPVYGIIPIGGIPSYYMGYPVYNMGPIIVPFGGYGGHRRGHRH